MALFLNRTKLNLWISTLIEDAKKEVVIIVPYIKISDKIFKSLSYANDKNIEIIIVYRENKLDSNEKTKLQGLKNVTMMHHPNVHCKSYFNGELLVIGSMNLYDYSEKNNREMGVLFHNVLINEKYYEDKYPILRDDVGIFEDARVEMQEIINGATIEKSGEITLQENFNIEIIQTKEEVEIERSQRLSKDFLNKKFRSFKNEEKVWCSKCVNYYDNIDMVFEPHRIHLKINLPEKDLKFLHRKWMRDYNEFEFHYIKYYWNFPNKNILIYKHTLNCEWEKHQNNETETNRLFENGINNIIKKYRILTGK